MRMCVQKCHCHEEQVNLFFSYWGNIPPKNLDFFVFVFGKRTRTTKKYQLLLLDKNASDCIFIQGYCGFPLELLGSSGFCERKFGRQSCSLQFYLQTTTEPRKTGNTEGNSFYLGFASQTQTIFTWKTSFLCTSLYAGPVQRHGQ